ncbi:hypothetical protein, partial [Candidatus Aquicultor sp.]
MPAYALQYGLGVQEKINYVRGNYASNYVMVTPAVDDHVNSIYVRQDSGNKVEIGWDWQGAWNKPSWFIRTVDRGTVHEYFSYDGDVLGWPTTGTNYGFKIENAGVNSKTWYAKVNGYDKLFGNNQYNTGGAGRNFLDLFYGVAIIGSERNSLSDSNYAHFRSCQKIPNAANQPW